MAALERTHPANPAAQAASYLNRTAANLSSIAPLLEAARPRATAAEPQIDLFSDAKMGLDRYHLPLIF